MTFLVVANNHTGFGFLASCTRFTDAVNAASTLTHPRFRTDPFVAQVWDVGSGRMVESVHRADVQLWRR